MSVAVVYDPSDPIVANRVTTYITSINTPDYSGNPNTLINPDLSSVSGVDLKYWKYDSGSSPPIVEMTTAEKADVDDNDAEENEANDKEDEFETNLRKYFKMLKRLDRKASTWGMTNADLRNFAKDLYADSQDLKELFTLGISNPLVTFIDGYDTTNSLFTQAIQDELIGILQA
jgi:hypothetical protein